MIITLIAAVADNGAIGRHNQLPWHLPEDLKFFKHTTHGKPVVMGRKTFESLKKPLPGRLNIVLSKQEDLNLPEGALLFHTLAEAMKHLEGLNENRGVEEAFVIGGGEIFKVAEALAERIFITRVHTNIADADAFFPTIDHSHWKLSWEEKHQKDDRHQFDFTFQRYERTEL